MIKLYLAFLLGVACGVFLVGFLQANGRHPLDDEEQAAYLRKFHRETKGRK